MALAETFFTHTVNTLAAAAPTTSETITSPDDNTFLYVVVGGTATTITIVTPGNDAIGEPNPDKVFTSISNVTKLIKVDRNYRDPATGNCPITFSQVTGVTALVIRFGRA